MRPLNSSPSILYHYTSVDGLLGIFQSSEIWATDAEFLNDAQELEFGRSELVAELVSAAAPLVTQGYGSTGYNRGVVMISAAEVLRTGGGTERRGADVYVSCFCEEGDLLSQWRGYAAGGYAIGFETTALSAIDRRSAESSVPETTAWPAAHLVKIEYGPAAITSMVDRVLKAVAPDWVERMGKPGSRGAVHADTVAKPALASIKHQAFSEEREWRLVLVSVGVVPQSAEVRFRPTPFSVVPFLAMPFPLTAVSEIVIGPGNDFDVRERGVVRLIRHHGLDVVVKHSIAPFRAPIRS